MLQDNFNSKRELIWTVGRTFQGWSCSQCEWKSPLPTLLSDPEAKSAYDRLAAAKFRDHKCADHLARLVPAASDSLTARVKKMVAHGYKPKDAVELVLQEIQLEYRDQPKVLAQARSEADDFLRRLRIGLI